MHNFSKRMRENDDPTEPSDSDVISQEKIVVSNFFHNTQENNLEKHTICDMVYDSLNKLNSKLNQIVFSKPVEFVYNPTEYAFDVYKNYIQTYCDDHKSIMYLGMNPGPWGMSQTGVPFGEIAAVRDFLQLSGEVSRPNKESEFRPVNGFFCTRSEISGKRFWSLVKEVCGSPETFFKSSFVHNYCPLQLITSSGKNITPVELKKNEKDLLFQICDESLLDVIQIYQISIVVCIGRFVEERVKKIIHSLPDLKTKIKILYIPHPSPRALNNHNWQSETIEKMDKLGLLSFYKN